MLTEAEVKALVERWYQVLDDHLPSEQLMELVDENDLEMIFPEGPAHGKGAFLEWYERVTRQFFDEVHTLRQLSCVVDGDSADVHVVVNWKTRSWDPPAARSELLDFDAIQSWVVRRSVGKGRPVIVRYVVESLTPKPKPSSVSFAHIGLSCEDPIAVERFYTSHFGFHRARVYEPGDDQVVQITNGQVSLELFPATQELPAPKPTGAGAEYPGWRHIAFLVKDLDAILGGLGDDAVVTLGPLDMSRYIPGMRVCWIADPEGNIIELNEGYVDEVNPPSLASNSPA